MHDDIAEVLISEELLQARVRQLGKEISRDYEGKPLLLVGILKGAAVFLADLIRAIDVPADYDFVAISSYGNATRSSGVVDIKKDIDADLTGRHVLIVEDIVDTGWTLRLSYITEKLLARNAASVRICALLDKPSRREVDVDIDYRGFVIEDRFVVGYGLDLAGRYRNLPYIGVLKSDVCGDARNK
ncbi:MAG: hypoxanthine phosphoribosyltransferase [Armatimonadetes bacterium]|nr:hypoxanthine phosphoribosyltransferase [Armatimonadota bacterium]